jgi:hypothetical protein
MYYILLQVHQEHLYKDLDFYKAIEEMLTDF